LIIHNYTTRWGRYALLNENRLTLVAYMMKASMEEGRINGVLEANCRPITINVSPAFLEKLKKLKELIR
jgi:hypothetical protein